MSRIPGAAQMTLRCTSPAMVKGAPKALTRSRSPDNTVSTAASRSWVSGRFRFCGW
jgi:hypothetical protein